MITLTETAKQQLKKLIQDHQFEAFIYGAQGGGCSGFSYLFKEAKLSDKMDTDELVEIEGIKIILDGASLFAVAGTEIDFKSTLMGSNFEFNNPMSKSSCGCGSSFSV